MPFTLAHPAIVLPLKFIKKGWLSLTGLVIGSITPDFGYFVQLKALRGYGHSLHGIFWFDLPIAILLSFLFHEIIRNPLIQNSPSFLQKKLSRYLGFQWKSFFKQHIFSVVVSIIIGAFSHILWDSFTHVDGYFTQSIPALSEYISLGYTPITVHNLISVICSFLGLMVVLYSILQLPSQNYVSVNQRFTGYWLLLLLCTIVLAYIKLTSIPERMQTYWMLYAGGYVVIGMSSFCTSLLFTSLLYKYIFQRSLPGAQKNLH